MPMLAAVAGLMLIMGCAKAKPFDYQKVGEIPEGPGLFTKEKGKFTLYDSNKKPVKPEEPAQSASAPANAPEDPDAGEEFRRFQEWKQEREDFAAYQEWKRSHKGSKEYQEFEEWKRWREYKRWNDEQKNSNKIDY